MNMTRQERDAFITELTCATINELVMRGIVEVGTVEVFAVVRDSITKTFDYMMPDEHTPRPSRIVELRP